MQKRFIVVICLLVVGVLVLRRSPSGQDDEQTAREILQRDGEQKMGLAARSSDDSALAEFERLAESGKGQPLPSHLISMLDPERFWFIANPASTSAVEIPFPPGHVPKASETDPAGDNTSNPGFLGAAACRECHRERHQSFVHTAHHLTSQEARRDAIMGSFQVGENRMQTGDPKVYFEMIDRDDEQVQHVYFHGWRFEIPFHIITGSGKMAQTYLYWNEDKLYQMVVSYLSTSDKWVNSPGFVDGDARYARPIIARCLECHTTFIEKGNLVNQFNPSSLMTGISCERCHGPGKKHVDFHREHPAETSPQHIANPSALTRQQQLDICGQCHTGVTEFKSGPYQFRPGDRLEDHYGEPEDENEGSVHTSNQIARLSKSRCFTESQMTCSDCHNPHQNERGRLDLFSQRCIACHAAEQCGMHEQLGERLADNCIDCHMPKRGSGELFVRTPNATVFPKLRDHFIRVDSTEASTLMETSTFMEASDRPTERGHAAEAER